MVDFGFDKTLYSFGVGSWDGEVVWHKLDIHKEISLAMNFCFLN